MDQDQKHTRAEETPKEEDADGFADENEEPGILRRFFDGLVDDFFDAVEAVGSFRKHIISKVLPHRHSHRDSRRSRRSRPRRSSSGEGYLSAPGQMLPQQPHVEAFSKGLANVEHSKSTGIRPIQGKEVVPRFRNVLVVGGMDFFGAALVRQLNAVDFKEITVTDSLSDGVCRSLPALKFREFLTQEEFAEVAAARIRTLSDYSHIFYLDEWKPETIGLAKALLVSASKAGTRFIAGAPAFSMGASQPCAAEERHDPQNFRPLTQAGILSCMFDRYALTKSLNKNYLSLKYFQLFGLGEKDDRGLGRLVDSCHSQIRSNGSVSLPSALWPDYPEGQRKFDFFPVEDAARIALFLAQNHMADGIFELGSGVSATPEELVRAVVDATGGIGQIVWDENMSYSPPPAGPECARLERIAETGWKAYPADLKASVSDYVTNCLDRGTENGRGETTHAAEGFKRAAWAHTAIPQKKRPTE